jgi:soluble lytic murein transglycosylase
VASAAAGSPPALAGSGAAIAAPVAEASLQGAPRPPGGLVFSGPLAGLTPASLAGELFEQQPRFLARRGEALLAERWQTGLRAETAAWCWSAVAKQAALKFLPEAEAWFARADEVGRASRPAFEWSDDTLAWRLRAALRASDPGRWQRVLEAATRMSPQEQLDPAWTYWRGRALLAIADPGPTGDGLRIAGQLLLERIANRLDFYGLAASEQLGRPQLLPRAPLATDEAERQRAAAHPGLRRGLHMIALGLADEGRREWNFSLRELGDRELLAAARLACGREVWDRCITAADRTRQEIDLGLRYPQPFREALQAAASETALEPALLYGLIRQESRFITQARSGAGASGLMQVIPPTARRVAKQLGLPYSAELLTDQRYNLRIGANYLRMVLDDFGGSQALALAGYNAGPGRARRWREGPVMEVVAWAETIPFSETRDYVKKVLANAAYYQALQADQAAVTLRPRLSPPIAPRPADAPPENRDLP